MRFVIALLFLALPARADECFTGLPKVLTYDNGRTTTIIQRHGDSITDAAPFDGVNVVSKSQLMIFPLQARLPNRFMEYRWDGRLPKLDQLQPGYHFDLTAELTKDGKDPGTYRMTGDVIGLQEIKIGTCPYQVLAVATETYINGAKILATTFYLSPDMKVVLGSQGVDVSTGTQYNRVVTALK